MNHRCLKSTSTGCFLHNSIFLMEIADKTCPVSRPTPHIRTHFTFVWLRASQLISQNKFAVTFLNKQIICISSQITSTHRWACAYRIIIFVGLPGNHLLVEHVFSKIKSTYVTAALFVYNLKRTYTFKVLNWKKVLVVFNCLKFNQSVFLNIMLMPILKMCSCD